MSLIDFSRQSELSHPAYVDPKPKNEAEAKIRLLEYLNQRNSRRENLIAVLASNRIGFEESRDGLIDIMSFFHRCAIVPLLSDEFCGDFIEFLWNLSQYLGDILIDRSPKEVKINKWIVENVALSGMEPQYEFCICGYAYKSASFCPNIFLLDIARAIREQQLTAEMVGDYVVGRLNNILDLTARRCMKELIKKGKAERFVDSRYF